MAVLGHVTPAMTPARRAPRVRNDPRRLRRRQRQDPPPRTRLMAGPTGRFVPDQVGCIRSEWLKTRVAHGFCSRHPAACTWPPRQHLRAMRQLHGRPPPPAPRRGQPRPDRL